MAINNKYSRMKMTAKMTAWKKKSMIEVGNTCFKSGSLIRITMRDRHNIRTEITRGTGSPRYTNLNLRMRAMFMISRTITKYNQNR